MATRFSRLYWAISPTRALRRENSCKTSRSTASIIARKTVNERVDCSWFWSLGHMTSSLSYWEQKPLLRPSKKTGASTGDADRRSTYA